MNRHRIGKLHLDLRLRAQAQLSGHSRQAEGLARQQELEQLLQTGLLPALEALFDQMVGPDELLILERLDVDLSDLNARDWHSTLVQAIIRQVEEALQRRLASQTTAERIERIPLVVGRFEAWLHFLAQGTLPLHDTQLNEADLRLAVLEAVAGNTLPLGALRHLLRRDDRALRRLVAQHPEDFLRALAEASTGVAYAESVRLRENLVVLLQKSGQQDAGSGRGTATVASSDVSAALETLRTDFLGKYWRTIWSEIAREGRSPEAEALLELIFLQNLPVAALPGVILHLVKKAESTPRRYALTLPALRALAKKYAPGLPESGRLESAKPKLHPDAPLASPVQTDADSPLADRRMAEPPAWNLEPAPEGAQKLAETSTPTSREHAAGDDSEPVSPPSAPPLAPSATENAPLAAPPQTSRAEPTVPERPGMPPPPDLPSDNVSVHAESPVPARAEPPSNAAFWYVPNAGVVLLHPFLPALFRTLELTDGPVFRDDAAWQKAVYLLHYLATGAPDAPEYDLIFPKFLAGWPLEKPLDRPAGLLEKELDECNLLIHAVIGHWKKLGSTSPAGLREGFLQRPGKLSRAPFDGWKLQVEQATLDVLLGAMPWGIGVVKLPWMQEMVTVEWAY